MLKLEPGENHELGGGRYQLGESGRWMLNFDIMYGRPVTDFNAFGVQVTINVVSH